MDNTDSIKSPRLEGRRERMMSRATRPRSFEQRICAVYVLLCSETVAECSLRAVPPSCRRLHPVPLFFFDNFGRSKPRFSSASGIPAEQHGGGRRENASHVCRFRNARESRLDDITTKYAGNRRSMLAGEGTLRNSSCEAEKALG
jgi:hypothetical protein